MSFQAIRAWKTEVARYAKAEYGHPEAGWILARFEAERARRGPGWRVLLRRRRAKRRMASSAALPETKPAQAQVPSVAETPRRDERASCDHPELELLGNGGPATYYRCTVCGRVVIQDRDSLFVIRPSADAATIDSFRQVAAEVFPVSTS